MTAQSHDLVALVPMRHQSERVPEKNYRPLAGRPLYAHILETLTAVDELDAIAVDTDSDPIKAGIEERFPEVILLDRPPQLRAGDVPMNEVIRHDIQQVQSQFYLQTHSTNPLLRPETLVAAWHQFRDSYPQKDSLFGVTRLHTRLWSASGDPLNHDPTVLLRTQDLPPVYEENSCLYLFARQDFLASGNRIGSRPQLFEVPPDEAWDIDEEHDFAVVDCLVRLRKGLT